MQQILDRTQESLAQSFQTLARNARRQQHLYYVTVGLLIVIVIVSGLLLAGLAAARHLDVRRNHVAQYVSTISLQLQGETSLLRRTALTLRFYLETDSVGPVDAAVFDGIQRNGKFLSADGRYALLVPPATQQAWGHATAQRLWQLQQIATATITTQMAFQQNHIAYIVDADAAFAIILSPTRLPEYVISSLGPGHVSVLRDAIAQSVREHPGQPQQPAWIGPVEDPLLKEQTVTAVLATTTANRRHSAYLAVSIPASAFLARLKRPADPAMLLLINPANVPVDVSPPISPVQIQSILSNVPQTPTESLAITRSGLLLVQPLNPGFGSLVYALSLRTLAGSIAAELIAIGGIGVFLIGCIVLVARYWDVHLLRRGHAEAARALESETINHVLVSATPIGLCIVRKRDNQIITSNAVANALLGRAQGASLPAHIADALYAASAAPAQPGQGAIAQVTVPASPGASSHDAPDVAAALRQFLLVTCAPVRYGDEDVLFCAIQDVTAQHRLEDQLRAAREAAEAMMRARSNFFAAMSHEIRTPLNALLGNLELLVRADGMGAQASRLRALQVASDGLRRIVNDILDFSKIDAGEMKLANESFRPLEDLESLSMSYAPMVAERPIRFYVHLSPTLDGAFFGDRTRISQIIGNLLGNAFKFTACGKIVLSAEITVDTEQRTIFVCRVRDSGIGMPPTLVSRVFHPFVQAEPGTSARYGGTGLGLSICARLTELMDGHIGVESVEGVGSAFTISIPLPPAPGEQTAHEPAVRGSQAMVLCQEPESGNIIEAWLQRDGWRTQVFHQVDPALGWLRNNRPHILIVTGEYSLQTVQALRDVHGAQAVWITRNGPEHPRACAPGVFEVTTFDHAALLAAALAALNADDTPTLVDVCELDGATRSSARLDDPDATGRLQGPPRTILVAEDNTLNQTLIAEQLEALGWHAIVAGDGRQALAILEEDVADVDVVLTDIHMPVMDGYQLLAAVRALRPELPVLAYSAVPRDDHAGDWLARGFPGHIAKPASLRSLGTALSEIPVHQLHDEAISMEEHQDVADASPIPASECARYRAILREHLQHDEPELADIVLRRDVAALGHWAHRSAGAFLIVSEIALVDICRAVEHLCEASPVQWTDDIATSAAELLDSIRQFSNAHDADDTAPTSQS